MSASSRRLVAGLLERMGAREGRLVKAAFSQIGHYRKFLQLELSILGCDDMARDADIGEPGLRTERKGRRSPPLQQTLIGRQSFPGPMPAPTFDGGRVSAKGRH